MKAVRGNAPEGILRIELEDAATRKGWVSTLGLLAGAMQMWHFVWRRADGQITARVHLHSRTSVRCYPLERLA